MGLNNTIQLVFLLLLTISCSNVNLEKKEDTLASLTEGITLQGSLKWPESAGTEKPLKLKSFYILNLNAFVDSSGELKADSDGDGLTDQYEIDSGYGPLSVRSKSYCLDIIYDLYGCDCTAEDTTDNDNDSLSACEENILGTSDNNKDSDGDGILDFHEVIRGLNPLKNDEYRDSNQDSHSDLIHFLSGFNLYVNPVTAPAINRIQYTISESQLVGKTQAFSYDIHVSNIPLLKTFTYEYDSRAIIKGEDYSQFYLGSLPNGASQNQILIVYQAETLEPSPQSFWFIYRQNLDNTKEIFIDAPLSGEEFLEL